MFVDCDGCYDGVGGRVSSGVFFRGRINSFEHRFRSKLTLMIELGFWDTVFAYVMRRDQCQLYVCVHCLSIIHCESSPMQ